MMRMPNMSSEQMEELFSKMSPEERTNLEKMAKEQMGGMSGMSGMSEMDDMKGFDTTQTSSSNVNNSDLKIEEVD